LNQAPILYTSRRTAELIKYTANAFLATKITFINEIADLCEQVGADVQEVARGIGFDNRTGPTAPFGALVYERSAVPAAIGAGRYHSRPVGTDIGSSRCSRNNGVIPSAEAIQPTCRSTEEDRLARLLRHDFRR
jgi:hypothetical protein